MRSLVQFQLGPPLRMRDANPGFSGGVAQLGEHLLCTQEVIGSIPFTSTINITSTELATLSRAEGESSKRMVQLEPLALRLQGRKGSLTTEYREDNLFGAWRVTCQHLMVCDQATKGRRWMPWRRMAMKDVVSCDKPRRAAKQALTRGFPNGETHPA